MTLTPSKGMGTFSDSKDVISESSDLESEVKTSSECCPIVGAGSKCPLSPANPMGPEGYRWVPKSGWSTSFQKLVILWLGQSINSLGVGIIPNGALC